MPVKPLTLFAILSVIFLFLALKSAVKDHFGSRFDGYFFTMLTLSALFSIMPIRHFMLESHLANASRALLNNHEVVVDCQSYFESIFNMGFRGYVYKGSNLINLEVRTCQDIRKYLDDPDNADMDALFGLHVLTHEAMHVAGEFHEPTTDCMAFQRNHQMAELLGVSKATAVKNAREVHRRRSIHHPYYSRKCEPGREMDERLPGAVWERS